MPVCFWNDVHFHKSERDVKSFNLDARLSISYETLSLGSIQKTVAHTGADGAERARDDHGVRLDRV